MLLPPLLICCAIACAAVVAYGTSGELARYSHGIQIIILSRRLEWVMVILSIAFCIALLGLAISGRRRVWWLLGLSPVLALFIRGFSSTYRPATPLLESPQFLTSDQSPSVANSSEYVVGLTFDGKPYAFPYHALADSPLILLSGFDHCALLIWSMTANRAMILPMDRDTDVREIEIVSRPADSLLLFDARLGQFIVGVTGHTPAGATPVGFGAAIPSRKMPLSNWIAMHPDTLIMTSPLAGASVITGPLLPQLHFLNPSTRPAADSQIVMLPTTQPTAIAADISLDSPINIQAGDTRVLLERDPKTNQMRAFDRHLKEDLFLTFAPVARKPRKHPEFALVDSESASVWTLDGHAVDGPFKGQQLREIPIDDQLYWGVMKFWIPQLKLIQHQ